MALETTLKDGELRFEVRAKPRAKRSAIGDDASGALDVALAAPPVDGAANEELVRVLAKALGVPKRAVRIVKGEGSRHKLVGISGLAPDDLLARLAAARVRMA
jgi:uncharacterized protein (TIGR00251 family)